MEQKRLRIGVITNNISIKTGLGRSAKSWVPIIYQSGKYDVYFLNQSMENGDPSFQKYPWTSFGAMSNFDQNRFNQDQNFQRVVAYGNTSVESFITDNRLNACVLADDFWAGLPEYYFQTDWYKFFKDNFMFVATADSEPLLPLGKEWARNCPNMRFWTSFASRILKEENYELYKHCDTIHAALEVEDFKPLPKEEKLALRHKFNIQDDEKIIMYLGRNQLRKIFGKHIEGLAEFKKKNPDKKLRLLFHCSWAEPGGWPLNQIREDYGLKREDILTTYFCRNCQDWNIQPYEGEDLNCPHCNAQKSRITAGINSTISEKDLNKIYNLADGAASLFTSGGFEFFNAESLLAGIPLACPNYACGETFCAKDFVYTINGTFTFEHNTGFKKFVPYTKSVCDFFEYIYNLTEKERDRVSKAGRDWAVQEFDKDVIAKKYMDFFDSCKPIDWDSYFNRKKELKNVTAQVEDKQSDNEFIDHCYKTILNMDLPETDSGKIHWAKFLAQPQDKRKLRESLVNSFRMAAQEHNNKVQPQIPFESLLLNNGKKEFLLVCKESAGDILYATAILESLRKSYPSSEWNIYFACDSQFGELLDGNPYIDKVLPYLPFMEQEIQCTGQGERKGMFSGYIFLTTNTQRHLSYLTNNNVGEIK